MEVRDGLGELVAAGGGVEGSELVDQERIESATDGGVIEVAGIAESSGSAPLEVELAEPDGVKASAGSAGHALRDILRELTGDATQPVQAVGFYQGEVEPWRFSDNKEIVLKGGPCVGAVLDAFATDADGLIYFFRNNGLGRIEQAVYRVVLEEVERTEEERKAGEVVEWKWVGEYVGKRYMPQPMVNGVRKGS